MSVLRIHNQGNNTIQDWDSSTPYNSNIIDSIPDPNQTNITNEITSIPSPFARMDLTKTALSKVEQSGVLNGQTNYHKLVSDFLDVGQIFFELSKHPQIQLIEWNAIQDLQELLNSPHQGHRRLGETYRLFLNQDARTYNFNQLGSIYLLNYTGNGAPHQMNIIGATSPATLFFSSANDLSFITKNIAFGQDRPFDANFKPLYERDFAYQEFLYNIQKVFNNFAANFPEVDAYLNANFSHLSNEQQQKIRSLTPTTYQTNYNTLTVGGAGNPVDILGNPLRCRMGNATSIAQSSGFVIEVNVTVQLGDNPPLVLPVDTYKLNTKYTTASWDSKIEVPYYDNTPLSKRVLPDDQSIYPYLTIGDFLEDYIVRIPREANGDHFFHGHYKYAGKGNSDSYLLPIKKAFFNYFMVEDLRQRLPDGQNMFELEYLAGNNVKAILRIPIKNNNYITYERIYYNNQANVDANKGGIKEIDVAAAIFPNIKYNTGIEPFYRFSLVDRKSLTGNLTNYKINFYKGTIEVSPTTLVQRNRNNGGGVIDDTFPDSFTYVINQNFDFGELQFGNYKALLIPNFVQKVGGKAFTFSVDFGTTNTHIEYVVDNNPPIPFDVKHGEDQILKMHKYDVVVEDTFLSDFMPDIIGSKYSYPMRTVLAELSTSNWNTPMYAVADTNIPFIYENRTSPSYQTHLTDLKWSNDPTNVSRIEHYITNLLIMIRNKILLGGGDLSQTKVVWFYPMSMTVNRYESFKNSWDTLYKKYIDANGQTIAMSESFAPYYETSQTAGTRGADSVFIDIGGGTTDVTMFQNGNPVKLTSFRFAGNSIWGDGYAYDSSTNGFVSKYFEDTIKMRLVKNQGNIGTLLLVLENIEKMKKSPEIISFFVSLSNNHDLLSKNVNIDFSGILKADGALKYTFIVFYTAIVYHIANLMKTNSLELPRYVVFSGTASKVLDILASSNQTIELFTKLIFEEIYDKKYGSDGLTVIRPSKAKEVTCKGGAQHPVSQDYREAQKLNSVLVGTDSKMLLDTLDIDLNYDTITNKEIEAISDEVKRFIDFTFSLNKKFDFNQEFGADYNLHQIAKDECLRDISLFIKQGINLRLAEAKQTGATTKVDESLFFFPLVGVLNALSKKLAGK